MATSNSSVAASPRDFAIMSAMSKPIPKLADPMTCPKCGSSNTGNNGKIGNIARRRCNDCSKQYSAGPADSVALEPAQAKHGGQAQKADNAGRLESMDYVVTHDDNRGPLDVAMRRLMVNRPDRFWEMKDRLEDKANSFAGETDEGVERCEAIFKEILKEAVRASRR